MDTDGGNSTSPDATAARRSSGLNHRASEISSPSTWTASGSSARAVKPSIRDDGKGHGWLPR